MPDVGFRSSSVERYRAAATRRGLSLSDWLREACESALRADGFSTGVPERQYALVTPAGEIIAQGFSPAPNDRGEWLPIENRDSAPFDPAKHWRLKPQPLRVEGNLVVREYPVTVKSIERARPLASCSQ